MKKKSLIFWIMFLTVVGLLKAQESNLPIIPSTDTGAGAVWYTIYFDAGPDFNGYRGFCALNASSLGKINIDGGNPNVADERYQFCFIGDEVNGFEIYNRAFLAGKTVKKFDNTTDITLTADSKLQTVASDGSDLWIAFPETALPDPVTKWFFREGNGFIPGGGGGMEEVGEWTLYSPDDNKGMNINGGSLVYYQTIDWGTTWRLSFHRVTGQNVFPIAGQTYTIKNADLALNLGYDAGNNSLACNTSNLEDEAFQFEFEPITGNESYGNFYRLKNVASGMYVKAPEVTTASNKIVMNTPFSFTSDANDLDNIACRLQLIDAANYKIIFKKNNVAVTVDGTGEGAGIRCDYEMGETPLAGHPWWRITVLSDDNTIPAVQAIQANDFLNSIGVNAGINTRGEKVDTTLTTMKYIGARWIRNGPPSAGDGIINDRNTLDCFRKLYDEAGIRFSIMLPANGNNGIAEVINGAKMLINDLSPDAFLAFEGPNEPNNWNITYNNQKQTSEDYMPLAKYQSDFYAAVKADPMLKDYPVWSSTDAGGAQPKNYGMQYLTIPASETTLLMPAGTKYADVANVHNYFSGVQPYTNNQTWRAANRFDANSLKTNFGKTWRSGFQGYTDEELMDLPCVTTETGTKIEGITEEYQALTFLSCYLAQFKQGFDYTAMYLLRDRIDEGGNQSYGFFESHWVSEEVRYPSNPRLSAHYMHNMTTILADDPNQNVATPATLEYSIPGCPETVHDLLLQKSDGKMFLVVWGEKYAAGSMPEDVTIQFGQASNMNIYNPAQWNASQPEQGTQPVRAETNASEITLSMLDHPWIIELDADTSLGMQTTKTSSMYFYNNTLFVTGDNGLLTNIYDVSGKIASTFRNEGKFDLSNLSKGVYIAKTTNNDVLKIIVK